MRANVRRLVFGCRSKDAQGGNRGAYKFGEYNRQGFSVLTVLRSNDHNQKFSALSKLGIEKKIILQVLAVLQKLNGAGLLSRMQVAANFTNQIIVCRV